MFLNQSEATIKPHVVKMGKPTTGAEELNESPLIRENAEDKHAARRAKKMANKLHFALTQAARR
jgi:hypothetical protein